MQPKAPTPLDTESGNTDAPSIDVATCARCRKPYRPRKANQRYCGNGCRRRVLALRKQLQRHLDCLDSQPGLSARTLRDQTDGARQAAGLPPMAPDTYLQAQADVAEAEAQAARWAALLSQRRAKLAKANRTRGRAHDQQLLLLRPGHGRIAIDARWTHCAISSADPSIAVLALALYTSPK